MKTQEFLKIIRGALAIAALFSFQSMAAQQNITAEDIAPMHSLIFIARILFFIIGFMLLIILKFRDDAKDKRESNQTTYVSKHRHHHPNHYGHHHQYH